ncbi:MAG: hypothetical protein PHG82_01170 [Candidatus Gracilibacteria bacterium]|nr:hypothetical protein [Candidatus Gracilibacteria bacterium]
MENLESLETAKEYLTKEQIEEIKKLDYECVWVLSIYKNGDHKFVKIRDGNDGEVSFDKSILENKIGIKEQYLYHNHSITNYNEETDKNKDTIIIAPPSSDDFMQVNRSKKELKHRIIAPSGIWEISINNFSKTNKVNQFLGSLFSELEIKLKRLELKKENPIYLNLAESYNILMHGSTDKSVIEKNIKIFKENMFKMGFNVDFKFYT